MIRRAFLSSAICCAAILAAGSGRAEGLVVVSPRDSSLDLRAGPGSGFDIIIAMPNGSQVQTLEWSGSWVRVRHESGRTGWCVARYLARAGSSAQAIQAVGGG